MDREKLAFAAMMPLDTALGLAVTAVKSTVGIEKISDGFYSVAGSVLRNMYEKNNDLKAEGLENVPAEGGVLFASNHQSWNDVQVLGAACPRRLRFLAKAMFREWPVLRHLIELSDSPFIKRGGDSAGMASAVEALRSGKALAIFPEGTIPGEEKIMRQDVEAETGLLRGHTGAVRLAIAAKAPIIPVGVSGTGLSFPPEVYPRLEILEAPKNVPVVVRFGEPMTFEELYDKEELTREELREATNRLMAAISALVDHDRNYIPIEVPIAPLEQVEKLGVLLLHGFTSSVKTVAGLVPYLEAENIPYRMPVLRGHGTHYTDMSNVTSQDWYDDAEAALDDLLEEVDKVAVVGLSMGGLVALNLGIRRPEAVISVTTLAAAMRFKDPLSFLTPLLAKVVKSWPSPESFNDKNLKKDGENYPRFMTAAFSSLYNYAQETEARLSQMERPICVLQSKKDQVVTPLAANLIYRNVGSKNRESQGFEQSGHEMGQDMEKEAVFETVMTYVKKFRKVGAAKD